MILVNSEIIFIQVMYQVPVEVNNWIQITRWMINVLIFKSALHKKFNFFFSFNMKSGFYFHFFRNYFVLFHSSFFVFWKRSIYFGMKSDWNYGFIFYFYLFSYFLIWSFQIKFILRNNWIILALYKLRHISL